MKSLLIIILITVICSSAKSQIISNCGLKLGVGISNQSWDYQAGMNLDWNNKIGISPRIFADFFNYSFFQLEGEIGFLRKGIKDKIPVTTSTQPDGNGNYYEINNKLDYLIVSALAKFRYNLGTFSPYIQLGPQLNILLNKNIAKGIEVVFDKYKESNIGLSIGAGSELNNILPVSILVEYRYEKDFINNYDSSNLILKNYSHVILLGIKI